MRKLMFVAAAVLILSLIGCAPYQDTMVRTLPVLNNYEQVLQGKQLTSIQREAYLNECQATQMAITEALKKQGDATGATGLIGSPNPQPVNSIVSTGGSDSIIVQIQNLIAKRNDLNSQISAIRAAVDTGR